MMRDDMSIITKALKKAQDTRRELSAAMVHLSPSVKGNPQRQTEGKRLNTEKNTRRQRLPKTNRIELISNGRKRSAANPHRFLSTCLLLSTILGSLIAVLLYINRSSVVPLKVSPFSGEMISTSSQPEDITTAALKEPDRAAAYPSQTPAAQDKLSKISADSETSEKIIEDLSENLPVLTGIMYSPFSPQAVINGRMVAEGEAIAGFSILNILPDRVKIASGNEEFDLKIR